MEIIRASPKDAIEFVRKHNPAALSADGLDFAILGHALTPPVLVYSGWRIVGAMRLEGLDHDEALENFRFNIEAAGMGKLSPIFISDF